jgi:hypothetical protein
MRDKRAGFVSHYTAHNAGRHDGLSRGTGKQTRKPQRSEQQVPKPAKHKGLVHTLNLDSV